MAGAARPQTAFKRIEKELDVFKAWATELKLDFSSGKTQLLSLKGGFKPGYTIGFGTDVNDPRVMSTATTKYLGVLLDSRQSYWDHVVSVSQRSSTMYRRLRALYSANWGMGRAATRAIYRGVLLPRAAYAAEIWAEGTKLVKSRKKLLAAQRTPLLAMTSAYETSSTNCLATVTGTLPLDLEVRYQALKRAHAREKILIADLSDRTEELMKE